MKTDKRTNRPKMQFWKCPVPGCQFSASGKYCASDKNKHVRRSHPDRKKELSNWGGMKVQVQPVPDGQCATWRCPSCDWGLTCNPASKAGQYARMQHRAQKHPRKSREAFTLSRKEYNKPCVKAMNVAVRNGAAMRRLSQMKQGLFGPHDISTFIWMFGPRKNRSQMFCRKCRRMGKRPKDFSGQPCKPVLARKQLRSRFEKAIEKAKPCEKAEIRRLASMLLDEVTPTNMTDPGAKARSGGTMTVTTRYAGEKTVSRRT